MIITKYEHACLVLDLDDQQLIIDPGVLSPSFVVPENPVAVVITHIHVDHFDKDLIDSLLASHSNLSVFTVDEVAAVLNNPERVKVITNGSSEKVGNFELDFYGENHQIVHPSAPRFKNSGVMVNKQLYYPGDSFTMPGKPVTILALPTSGPWLKIGESIDFMLTIKPEHVFPTHDVLLSEDGVVTTNNWLSRYAKDTSTKFKPLVIGQPAHF